MPARPSSTKTSAPRAEKDRIADLLRTRPDLAYFEPQTVDQLDSLAVERNSLAHCIAHLNRTNFEIFELCRVSGAISTADIADHAHADLTIVEESLGQLAARGLITNDDGLWNTVDLSAIQDTLPLNLGRTLESLAETANLSDLNITLSVLGKVRGASKAAAVHELTAYISDPGRMRALKASAPADAQQLLELLVTRSPAIRIPYSYVHGRQQTLPAAVTWLANHGLLFQAEWSEWMLPKEASVALRNGDLFPHGLSVQPELQTKPHRSDASAAAMVSAQLVASVNYVSLLVEMDKPKTLASGGMSVKDAKYIQENLGVDPEKASLLIELTDAAGLIDRQEIQVQVPNRGRSKGTHTEFQSRFRATELANELSEKNVGSQWTEIARAWLSSERDFSIGGKTFAHGKTINALARVAPDFDFQCLRYSLLTVLAQIGVGNAFVSTESLATYIQWFTPHLVDEDITDTQERIEEILTESEYLGLTNGLGITEVGAVFLTSDFDATAAFVTETAPTAAQDLMVQGDGTIIVGGIPSATLLTELTKFADIESRDAAMILRIREASLRRAFDLGQTADEVIAFLNETSKIGVPQAVTYIINDVQRQHGNLVVGAAQSFIQSDDPVVLTDVVHNRALAKFGVRLIASTVAVANIDPERLMSELQKAAFMPRLENGVAVVEAANDALPAGEPDQPAPDHIHLVQFDAEQLTNDLLRGNK